MEAKLQFLDDHISVVERYIRLRLALLLFLLSTTVIRARLSDWPLFLGLQLFKLVHEEVLVEWLVNILSQLDRQWRKPHLIVQIGIPHIPLKQSRHQKDILFDVDHAFALLVLVDDNSSPVLFLLFVDDIDSFQIEFELDLVVRKHPLVRHQVIHLHDEELLVAAIDHRHHSLAELVLLRKDRPPLLQTAHF